MFISSALLIRGSWSFHEHTPLRKHRTNLFSSGVWLAIVTFAAACSLGLP